MNVLFVNQNQNRGGAAELATNLSNQLTRRGVMSKFIVDIKNDKSTDVYGLTHNALLRVLNNVTGKDFDLFLKNIISKVSMDNISFGADKEIFNHPYYIESNIVSLHNIHGGYFKLSNLVRMAKEKKVFWTLHDMWSVSAWDPFNNYSLGLNGFYGESEYLSNRFSKMELLQKKKDILSRSNINLVLPSYWIKNKLVGTILSNKVQHVIHNGIDTKIFSQSSKLKARKILNLPLEKKIVLFISNGGLLNIQKGGDVLQKLSNYYPEDIVFVCVGGETDHNGRIIERKFVDDKQILSLYYSAADVFLLCSKAETFPLSVLESMSCGTPVVSFEVGGVSESIVNNKTGILCKQGEIDEIINGINFFFKKDKLDGLAISTNCRKHVVTNFSLEVMGKKYFDLFSNSI